MEKKGLSVYELAKKADLTEACIRNWYTKRNYTPSLEAIEKICCALDILRQSWFAERMKSLFQ